MVKGIPYDEAKTIEGKSREFAKWILYSSHVCREKTTPEQGRHEDYVRSSIGQICQERRKKSELNKDDHKIAYSDSSSKQQIFG